MCNLDETFDDGFFFKLAKKAFKMHSAKIRPSYTYFHNIVASMSILQFNKSIWYLIESWKKKFTKNFVKKHIISPN